MDKVDEILTRGVEKIYPSEEALEKVLKSGKKLKIYLGCDARRPILHLGHAVVLKKLRQFQDLGHKVIFLIGDFTTLIGDPSDQKTLRQKLTPEQIKENTKTFKKQAAKIVRFEGKNRAELRYNSRWLSKLTLADVLNLASRFTVPQMTERDMFQLRLKKGKPLYLHEILYPLMQAYDSVALDVDMEIGGTDQTFNMLCGRSLMKTLKGKEKFVLTVELLTGTDGQKMSKSLDNYIPLEASANEMFGKIMSMKDELIIQYFELLTTVPLQLIKQHQKLLQSNGLNPMELKKQLAFEIVKMYHGELNAKNAEKEFERVFQKRKVPEEVIIVSVKAGEVNFIDLMVNNNLVNSRAEAKRLITQGGIDVDGKRLKSLRVKIKDGTIVKIGKRRFAKIEIK